MSNDKRIIIFKNRVEVKILLIAFAIVFIPFLVYVLISLVKSFDFGLLFVLLILPVIFLFILYPINRFNVTFDYQKEEIRFTNYFTKTKVISFKNVIINCVKSKTRIVWDYDYIFYSNNEKIFKISSVDFESQTKESITCLESFFSDIQKSILKLQDLSIKETGYIEIYAFSLQNNIAHIVLDNDYFIQIKYDSDTSCFRLVVCDIEEKIVEDYSRLYDETQLLINKYQEYSDLLH